MPALTLQSRKAPVGLKVIAAAKLAKGVAVAFLSLGVFDLIHRDLGELARRLVHAARISPENRYVALALERLGLIDPAMLVRLGILTALDASIQLVEGFGLWIGAAWAEYLVVISTGIFVPEEFLAMIHNFTWPRVAILVINAVILVYVATLVWRRTRERMAARAALRTDSGTPR
jgi:uncharacterized membrane protein (DUF2068 family)